ncbi:MAG: nucleoside-diphosphate kinase [Rhizobiaceae bacterium]|nr:nucleoside-diphosphate kinase [Rhizobiaceae bacterium]
MSQDECILTTKDYTIIEVMRDRCVDVKDPLRPLLERKLKSARIIFSDDAPPALATISSRVSYIVNGGPPHSRILSHGKMNAPIGLFLPIITLRGLALLGLMEGQEFSYENRDGQREHVLLEAVQFQPEAARREKQAAERLVTPEERRSRFRVIGGQAPHHVEPNDFNDPGPSAA